MKLYRNAIILGIVAVLLAAAYFALGRKDDKKPSDSGTANSVKLLNVDFKKTAEIDISYKGEQFVISNQNLGWSLKKPGDIRYDKALIDALPLSLLYLTADKRITEQTSEPEKYGLDKPAKIAVKYTDGKSTTLDIGNPTATGDGYYVRVEGSDAVYTISNSKANSFFLTRKGLKDKNILALHDYKKIYNKIDEINSLIFERKGKKVFSAVRVDENTWSFTYPTIDKVSESVLKPILDSIVRVAAKEFIDENPEDLDQYGLKYPAYSLEFSTSSDRKKLLIGAEKVSGREFYASVDGSKDVFSLDEAGFNYLDESFMEILHN